MDFGGLEGSMDLFFVIWVFFGDLAEGLEVRWVREEGEGGWTKWRVEEEGKVNGAWVVSGGLN